ncbi:OPT oligopeptide transporter [Mycena olivaceomarginata]|nr:OPT oligopeptide transporter [Mycena olivaceomarginata]
MSETPAADNNAGSLPELTASKSRSTSSIEKTMETEKVAITEVDSEEDVDIGVIENAEDVAIQIISTYDDPTLPSITFRSIFLGVGLSAFSSVLATIYTFKPQNASVSQLFCLIIAYVLGTAMHSVIPSHGIWRYLNPGPFNLKEHTVITIMSGTASNVATGMEIIAALDLFYDLRLNAAVAIFQIFATQMVGYGIAGLLRTFLVYPTYAFYPNYISVVNLLQSLHWRGTLNAKKRRFFWIVFAAIFFWEWIPQYPMPILTAISVICLADNGRHEFVRNLFGAGSSNEGIGLLSVSTSWTLITQGTPLVWPLQTQINSFIGMWLGYIVLTICYYSNVFNGRDLPFMSTSLFSETGDTYNQSEVITVDYKLNATALETVGLPRYSTTYAISQLCYNLSLAFGGLRFLKRGHAEVDDPHYKEMQKYRTESYSVGCWSRIDDISAEVPQWVYALLFFVSIGVGIGCSYAGPHGTVLMPAWSIIFFTVRFSFPNGCLRLMHRSPISHRYDWVSQFATNNSPSTDPHLNQIQYQHQIRDSDHGCVHPPCPVMYATFTVTAQVSRFKAGQYTKLPPRITFGTQMAGSIVGAIFNYTSASIAMGALGKELFAFGKPYWLIPFAMYVLGLFMPLPFWAVWKFSDPKSKLAKTRRPKWFAKYNYILSAALDGGSQVILFILSFAVFGASGKAITFPSWWGNPANLSVDRCKST